MLYIVAHHPKAGNDHMSPGKGLVIQYPVGPIMDMPVQPRRKLFQLRLPIIYQRGGTDHQMRLLRIMIYQVLQESDGLQGLPQAHIIRQDAAPPHFIQQAHPLEPRLLIIPETGLYTCRHCMILCFPNAQQPLFFQFQFRTQLAFSRPGAATRGRVFRQSLLQ